jgi:hypothetical protein
MVTPSGLPLTIRVTAQDANAAKIARRKVRHERVPCLTTRGGTETFRGTPWGGAWLGPAASGVCTLRTITGKARRASIKPGAVRQYLDAAKRRTRQLRRVHGEMPRSSPRFSGAAASRRPIARHARTMARLPRGSAQRSRAVEWRAHALLVCATPSHGAPGTGGAAAAFCAESHGGKRCGPKLLACG